MGDVNLSQMYRYAAFGTLVPRALLVSSLGASCAEAMITVTVNRFGVPTSETYSGAFSALWCCVGYPEYFGLYRTRCPKRDRFFGNLPFTD